MSLPDTELTEQYAMNRSFDEVFNIEIVKGVGYDSVNAVLRPIACDDTGQLKVVA